jgi:hypothetical protein
MVLPHSPFHETGNEHLKTKILNINFTLTNVRLKKVILAKFRSFLLESYVVNSPSQLLVFCHRGIDKYHLKGESRCIFLHFLSEIIDVDLSFVFVWFVFSYGIQVPLNTLFDQKTAL